LETSREYQYLIFIEDLELQNELDVLEEGFFAKAEILQVNEMTLTLIDML
jgi:hypothetical protein